MNRPTCWSQELLAAAAAKEWWSDATPTLASNSDADWEAIAAVLEGLSDDERSDSLGSLLEYSDDGEVSPYPLWALGLRLRDMSHSAAYRFFSPTTIPASTRSPM